LAKPSATLPFSKPCKITAYPLFFRAILLIVGAMTKELIMASNVAGVYPLMTAALPLGLLRLSRL
jgi:hypothetical protein